MAASNQIFLVMDAGTPVTAFTTRRELQAYFTSNNVWFAA